MSLLSYVVKPLAYVSLPVFLLHAASSASPLARYYVRLGLYLSAMGVCSVWGVIASVGMTLAGRRFDINWVVARSFYRLTSRLLGIYITVEGEEHLSVKPAVLVGNHQSMLDILYIGRILPLQSSMSAKKELQWMPLLGQFMTLSGAIFIDRKNNARAIQSVAAAGETIRRRGTSVWMFPEGTRTSKPVPDLLPFKKGAFHLAIQSGVPITPVVCEHYWKLYHAGTLESGNLKIKVLPPVPTTGLTTSDASELARKVREQMLSALYEISNYKPETSTSISEAKLVERASSSSTEKARLPVAESSPLPDTAPKEVKRESPSSSTVVVPLAIDTSAGVFVRHDGSDTGVSTEEDEGMVLVGRPDSDASS